jgi:hypothetical protein
MMIETHKANARTTKAEVSPSIAANDLAPKFYPALSSLFPLGLPCWAVGATGAGAELLEPAKTKAPA